MCWKGEICNKYLNLHIQRQIEYQHHVARHSINVTSFYAQMTILQTDCRIVISQNIFGHISPDLSRDTSLREVIHFGLEKKFDYPNNEKLQLI